MEINIKRNKKQNHKITTIQDILNATDEENIDNFLKDLKLVMMGAYLLRATIGIVNCKDLFCEPLEWKDDGMHNINFEIEPK